MDDNMDLWCDLMRRLCKYDGKMMDMMGINGNFS